MELLPSKLRYLWENVTNPETDQPYTASEIVAETRGKIAYPTWYRYVGGQTVPTSPKLVLLARVFGVTLDYLANDDIPVENIALSSQFANKNASDMIAFRARGLPSDEIEETIDKLNRILRDRKDDEKF